MSFILSLRAQLIVIAIIGLLAALRLYTTRPDEPGWEHAGFYDNRADDAVSNDYGPKGEQRQ